VEGGVETLARQFRKAVKDGIMQVAEEKGQAEFAQIFSVLKMRNKVSNIRNSDQ
jgi:hypothetical protein